MRNRTLTVCILLGACAGPPDGLRETPKGPGPVVVVDWDAEPLPELPFPNDLAARVDPTSPTGLRVNISMEAPTELESRSRRKIDELTGFGTYAPITMRFDAPLDLDEIVRRHDRDLDLSDDAVYVIDVTPGSPTYLQAVDLDVGHGRFPQDVGEADVYFPNDPLADTPSILFDTHDEDRNGNGRLDPGEDVDGDGWLDVPNVYPEGGDPRQDLLTWYERVSNTLIVRPVVPLREETRYAVVLTERLVGVDGDPVRSPWEWVNHTRQTEALQPAVDALAELDLGVDDIAYAWVFTTGRQTGDLVDIRRGLDGEGPFSWMREEFPPGFTRAHPMHAVAGVDNKYILPSDLFTGLIPLLGLVDDSSGLVAQGYAWGEGLVGASFLIPDLLADRDDGGFDAVDEWWELDAVAGTLSAEPLEIAVTCAIPKETAEHKAPFPVAMWGHGYGSTRLEAFLFAWAFLPHGIATCAVDNTGHGPGLSAAELEEFGSLINGLGLGPFLDHLLDARYVDVDNDGTPDSGASQWTADAFHTRDNVRQASVDWMWLSQALRQCGTGTFELDGRQVVSCDWNQDGVPDIGGPDADLLLAGGSLGGINTAVAAAVLPELSATVPVVAAGGLMDVSTRAPTGGAVEAMHGKILTPLFLGYPDGADGLDIFQMANSYMDMGQLKVGHLDQVPAGGRVVVKNKDNGEVREIVIPADGAFRVGIPADAADYFERRAPSGMPPEGPSEPGRYTVPDNAEIGDVLVVSIYDAAGELVAKLDTFAEEGVFQGVTYEAGSRLVALSSGLGRVRAAPETRRLITVVQMTLEPGDPVVYAPHWTEEPFEALGGKTRNVLLMPTPGDMIVSINSEIALGRAAGWIERHELDPRYGQTIDDWLIDTEVVRGLEEFGPWTNSLGEPVLFDADDFDGGINEFGEPSDAPLRLTVPTDAGISGMRIPYVEPTGSHAFSLPDPSREFDISRFAINQIAWYLTTRGQELSDDPCLEAGDCAWMPVGEP